MTSTISRRSALSALGALPMLAACSHASGSKAISTTAVPRPAATPTPHSTPATSPRTFHPATIPSKGTISTIPSAGRQVAITVDDGIRADVIGKYADASARNGLRVTFFANGCYDSWRQEKKTVVAGIESGRIVVGNHTFSHPNLTRLSDAQIAAEITKNERHFRNLYGVNLRPYFRPPYGYINARVARVVRECGYDAIVMWNGTLGDDQNISASKIIANAEQYLSPGGIIIGHANHPGILTAMNTVNGIITSRHLSTVTVKDVLHSAH